MFSTTDAATDRHLHIYEVTETLRREVPLPTGLEEAVRRVLTLPNDAQMRKLATLLIEQRRVSPLNRIEIQVWSSHYDPQDLRPRSALLRYYRSDAALPP